MPSVVIATGRVMKSYSVIGCKILPMNKVVNNMIKQDVNDMRMAQRGQIDCQVDQ